MREALWGWRHGQTDTRLAQSDREVGRCSAVHLKQAERKSLNLRAWPFFRQSLNKGFAKLDFAKLGGLLYFVKGMEHRAWKPLCISFHIKKKGGGGWESFVSPSLCYVCVLLFLAPLSGVTAWCVCVCMHDTLQCHQWCDYIPVMCGLGTTCGGNEMEMVCHPTRADPWRLKMVSSQPTGGAGRIF